MTEPNDPYADKPYVPPAARGGAEDPSQADPEAQAEPTARIDDPAVTDPAVTDPAEQHPAQSEAQSPRSPFDEAHAQWPQPQADPESALPDPAGPSWQQEPTEPTLQQPIGAQPEAVQPESAQPESAQPESAQPGVAPPYPASQAGGTGEPPVSGPPTPAGEPPSGRRSSGRMVAGLTALALLVGAGAGAGGGALYYSLKNDSTGSSGTALDSSSGSSSLPTTDVEKVAASVLPATVQINFASSASGSQESEGLGTGIVISASGDILTNNHVVEEAANGGRLVVTFNNGKTADAKIVGRDAATDVAVIKAQDVTGLKVASLGDSKELRVGQQVVAIGSPYGLESTVTTGIVSALNRPVSPAAESTNSQVNTAFPAIQTDAAINPGNSGGPLVDLQGRVIGINSAIKSASDSSGSASGSIGLGFAIPINLAKNVATQILDGKTVEHARIGVTVSNASSNGGLTISGAKVAKVEADSAGAKAGLKAGDVITGVDGNPVAGNTALIATIRGYSPGDKVTLTIQRGGKTQDVDVTLGSDNGELSK